MTKKVLSDMGFGMKKMHFVTLFFGALICLFSVSGCDDRKQAMKDPKAGLREAVQEYWTNRFLKKNYAATYEMEAEKGAMSFETYQKEIQNARQFYYLRFEIKEINVSGNEAAVVLIFTIQFPMVSKEVKIPLYDKWVLGPDGWMHVLSKKK